MTLTMTPRVYPVASLCKDSHFGDVATHEKDQPPVASSCMTGRKRPSRKGLLTLELAILTGVVLAFVASITMLRSRARTEDVSGLHDD